MDPVQKNYFLHWIDKMESNEDSPLWHSTFRKELDKNVDIRAYINMNLALQFISDEAAML